MPPRIDSGRAVLVPAALVAGICVISLFETGYERRFVQSAVPEGAACASPSSAPSSAELVRRAAIAALGPLKSKGVNAVDLYARAMALYAMLTDKEKNILKHPKDPVDPAEAAALFAKLQPIMAWLRNAGKADYVDWGLGELTFGTKLKAMIEPIQYLGQAALWESGYRFGTDPDGAMHDLAACEALSRSGNNCLIGVALASGLHQREIDLIAQYALALDGAAAEDLAYLTSPADAAAVFQAGMNGEVSIMQRLMDQLANPTTQNRIGGITEPPSPLAIIPPLSATSARWIASAAQAMSGMLLTPEAQFQPWLAREYQAAAGNTNETDTMRGYASVAARERVMVVENAMLMAGVALVQGAQGTPQSLTDPLTGLPFSYVATPGGFQLSSTILLKGKPVSLSFSTPAPR